MHNFHTCTHTHSTLTPSLLRGNTAAAAIIDYIDTISIIQEALNITSTINETILQLQNTIDALMAEGLEDEANYLLERSRFFWSEARRLDENVTSLSFAVQSAMNQVEIHLNETDQISSKAIELRHLVNSLWVAADMFSSTVSMTLNTIDMRHNEVQEDHDFISSTVPELLSNVNGSLNLVNATHTVSLCMFYILVLSLNVRTICIIITRKIVFCFFCHSYRLLPRQLGSWFQPKHHS